MMGASAMWRIVDLVDLYRRGTLLHERQTHWLADFKVIAMSDRQTAWNV
jgi:hypothetical protein